VSYKCNSGITILTGLWHGPVSENPVDLSWLIGASWLIWCTIDPRINRITRINHLNPVSKTDKRGKMLVWAASPSERAGLAKDGTPIGRRLSGRPVRSRITVRLYLFTD
jgi:hypothetical protein